MIVAETTLPRPGTFDPPRTPVRTSGHQESLTDSLRPVLAELLALEATDTDLVGALNALLPRPHPEEVLTVYRSRHRRSDTARSVLYALHSLTRPGRRTEQREVAQYAECTLSSVAAFVGRARNLGVLRTKGGIFDPHSGRKSALDYEWRFTEAMLTTDRRALARAYLWAVQAGVKVAEVKNLLLAKKVNALRLAVQTARMNAKVAAERAAAAAIPVVETPAVRLDGATSIADTIAGLRATLEARRAKSNKVADPAPELETSSLETSSGAKSNRGGAEPPLPAVGGSRPDTPGVRARSKVVPSANWTREDLGHLSYVIDAFGESLRDNAPRATRAMALNAETRYGLVPKAILGALESTAIRTREDMRDRRDVRGRGIASPARLWCWRFRAECERLAAEVAA